MCLIIDTQRPTSSDELGLVDEMADGKTEKIYSEQIRAIPIFVLGTTSVLLPVREPIGRAAMARTLKS